MVKSAPKLRIRRNRCTPLNAAWPSTSHTLPSIEASWTHRLRHVRRGAEKGTWLEVQVDETWIAAYRLESRFGYAVPVELRVIQGQISDVGRPLGTTQQGAPDTPITSRLLRDVTVKAHMDIAREVLAGESGERIETSKLWGFVRGGEDPPPSSGPKPKSDTHYAKLAARYVQLVNLGSTSPLVDLKRESDADGVPYSRDFFRDEIAEARRRGLLTKPPPGRAGGELTELARQLVKED